MTPNKFTVTLPALRKAGACVYGYNRVVRAIQGREFTDEDAKLNTYIRFAHADPISIRLIVASNGMDDALWALRCIDNAANDKDLRLFSVCCARQVEHLMRDPRSTNALDVAERHPNRTPSNTHRRPPFETAKRLRRSAPRTRSTHHQSRANAPTPIPAPLPKPARHQSARIRAILKCAEKKKRPRASHPTAISGPPKKQ
jgi:hypothetical protein